MLVANKEYRTLPAAAEELPPADELLWGVFRNLQNSSLPARITSCRFVDI